MIDRTQPAEDRVADAPDPLPTVIVTSVIRSAEKGQSHGGVFLVDLASGDRELALDWDASGIDWSGRGGDRGLRGIAFWRDHVILAASNEIFVYTPSFELVDSYTNEYLRHCHEIDVWDDTLYLTSCGFDSILEFDLSAGAFSVGHCVRPASGARRRYRGALRLRRDWAERWLVPRPELRSFDPERPGGPEEGDTCHLNSVTAPGGVAHLGGRVLDRLWAIEGGRLVDRGRVPLRSHNAQPFGDQILLNDTDRDRVLLTGRDGVVHRAFPVHQFRPDELDNVDLATGRARAAFGRGLTVWRDRYVIAGSSPATVAVHDLCDGATVATVTLTRDVRNAVHGLEVWPFGG